MSWVKNLAVSLCLLNTLTVILVVCQDFTFNSNFRYEKYINMETKDRKSCCFYINVHV